MDILFIDRLLRCISSGSSEDWPTDRFSPNFSYRHLHDENEVTVINSDIYGDGSPIVQSWQRFPGWSVKGIDDLQPEDHPVPAHLAFRLPRPQFGDGVNPAFFHLREVPGVHREDSDAVDWLGMGITSESHPNSGVVVPRMRAEVPEWAR